MFYADFQSNECIIAWADPGLTVGGGGGGLSRRRRSEIAIFYFARCVRKIALYSDLIHSFDWKSAVEHDDGV